MNHLIVIDWSITASIAAIVAAVVGILSFIYAIKGLHQAQRQTKLAEDSLKAATAELALTEQQLKLTEVASQQTTESLRLSREQVEQMRRADASRLQGMAPRVVAKMQPISSTVDSYVLTLHNSGATALYIFLTGYQADGQIMREFIQKLDPNESHVVQGVITNGPAKFLQYVRIRAQDTLGSKYITEYRSLGGTLAYPVFRTPWIGSDVLPRPARCSDEVSWDVEHFARNPGQEDEPTESGFDITAPA